MSKKKLSKLLALYLPYVVIGLLATNLGEAWRLAVGKELGDKIVSLMDTLPAAFSNPLPSLHPFDLFIGLCCGVGMRLAVYLKGKNAKKYRHSMEYGSARWGEPKDIEPFMAPKFEDNIILTKTERLMMSSRPPDPKNARNKNVLVVGGSGSGKTRFWLKPNLLQCHSSYVITDPKGSIVVECGNALLQKGYKLKIFNTINFSKSMRYNPMAYIHSEKDILKLVTALMTNTKGEGQGGDPFWDKAERLLLVSLIAYLHYEAPVEEQNFATLLEMLNTMQVSEDDETYQNPVELLKHYPEEIQKAKNRIAALKNDAQIADAHPQDKENFCGMTIKGMVFDEKKAAGERLMLACKEMPNADMMLLGTYRGFELNIRFDSFKNEHQIVLRGELSYPVPLGDDPRGNIVRLDNAIGNFADRIADAENALQNLEQQKQAAEVEVAKPFAQEEELAEKSARLAELDALLNMEHQSSRTEPEAEEKPDARPSVLAALEEKADKVEPVRPFKSYLDKDGDAR